MAEPQPLTRLEMAGKRGQRQRTLCAARRKTVMGHRSMERIHRLLEHTRQDILRLQHRQTARKMDQGGHSYEVLKKNRQLNTIPTENHLKTYTGTGKPCIQSY